MRVAGAARGEKALPVGEEAGEGVLLDGFDFTAKLGEGFATNLAENFGIAPFAVKAAGAKSTFEHAAFVGQQAQGVFNDSGIEGEAVRRFVQRERAMGAGKAADKFEDRLRNGLEQRSGQAGRQGDTERVTVAGGIFGGDESSGIFTAWSEADFEQAAGTDQTVNGFEERWV
jgi:hypothetical protein